MHYVIGDVHGCFDELMSLLDIIESEDPAAEFIFLGDFPDRGPKIRKTLDWMLDNITDSGKYRSVRGNHEQSVIDWFYDEYRNSYEDMSKYIEETYTSDEDKLRQYVECFSSFPLNMRLDITLSNGKVVPYRICHAAHRNCQDAEEQKSINLWERDFWGRSESDELTVCGHTPTIDRDFNLRDQKDMPGFICYRRHMINIDCGRCYPYENRGLTFLAAICLETLEEYYDATPEQRLKEYASSEFVEWQRKISRKVGMTDPEEINGIIYENNHEQYVREHGRSSESYYRKQIIDDFGFPEGTPYILKRF